jgi:hypothetical protein
MILIIRISLFLFSSTTHHVNRIKKLGSLVSITIDYYLLFSITIEGNYRDASSQSTDKCT